MTEARKLHLDEGNEAMELGVLLKNKINEGGFSVSDEEIEGFVGGINELLGFGMDREEAIQTVVKSYVFECVKKNVGQISGRLGMFLRMSAVRELSEDEKEKNQREIGIEDFLKEEREFLKDRDRKPLLIDLSKVKQDNISDDFFLRSQQYLKMYEWFHGYIENLKIVFDGYDDFEMIRKGKYKDLVLVLVHEFQRLEGLFKNIFPVNRNVMLVDIKNIIGIVERMKLLQMVLIQFYAVLANAAMTGELDEEMVYSLLGIELPADYINIADRIVNERIIRIEKEIVKVRENIRRVDLERRQTRVELQEAGIEFDDNSSRKSHSRRKVTSSVAPALFVEKDAVNFDSVFVQFEKEYGPFYEEERKLKVQLDALRKCLNKFGPESKENAKRIVLEHMLMEMRKSIVCISDVLLERRKSELSPDTKRSALI